MGEADEREKLLPLWDHVTELAKRLRIWIYTFALATIFFMVFPADLGFIQNPLGLYKPIIAVIIQAIRNRLLPPSTGIQLIAGSFTAPIELYVIASVVFGFVVSVPVLAYEIYEFVDPALKPNERGSMYPFVTGFSLLYLAGALFGFFILLPFIIVGSLFFLQLTGAAPLLNIDEFYNLVFFTVIISGFSFTFPVFLVLLVKFHIIGTSALTRNRKYTWAGLYILTAVITPDGGPLADLALFVPIIILFEGAIMVAKRYEKTHPMEEERPEPAILRCSFCGGPIDPGGVFCGRCGKSRI